jgi:tetratricopeptide (TPR) repeat protein
MLDSLQDAYQAYQQALYHLSDLKVNLADLSSPELSTLAHRHQEPRLWYGIGILYDRYGSLEHAEEAFSQVMRMAPDFEKANEIYFRLGIIYKQQQKYSASLDVSLSSEISKATFLTPVSASATLSQTLPNHSLKRTSGSRLAMCTSSKKM